MGRFPGYRFRGGGKAAGPGDPERLRGASGRWRRIGNRLAYFRKACCAQLDEFCAFLADAGRLFGRHAGRFTTAFPKGRRRSRIQAEPPQLARPEGPGIFDAYPRGRADEGIRNPQAEILKMQSRPRGGPNSVELPADREGLRYPSRPADGIEAANEDGSRVALGPSHQIQHVMHAVYEIDVPYAARAIQGVRPRSPPLACVAGQVPLRIVGLNLRYQKHPPPSAPGPDKSLAQQPAGNPHRVIRQHLRGCYHSAHRAER